MKICLEHFCTKSISWVRTKWKWGENAVIWMQCYKEYSSFKNQNVLMVVTSLPLLISIDKILCGQWHNIVQIIIIHYFCRKSYITVSVSFQVFFNCMVTRSKAAIFRAKRIHLRLFHQNRGFDIFTF